MLYGGKISIFHNGRELSLALTNCAVCMFVTEHLRGTAIDVDAIAWKLTCTGNVELDVDSNNTVRAIKVASEAECSSQAEGSEPMMCAQGQKQQRENAMCTLGGPFEEEEVGSLFDEDL